VASLLSKIANLFGYEKKQPAVSPVNLQRTSSANWERFTREKRKNKRSSKRRTRTKSPHPKISDDELLDQLIEMIEFNDGVVPKHRRITNRRTYIRRFGSIKNACRLAQMRVKRMEDRHLIVKYNKPGRPGRTSEEMLKELRKFGEVHGRRPTARDMSNPQTFAHRFGSWKRALRLAGYSKREISSRSKKSNK